jgi:hypothetical protein
MNENYLSKQRNEKNHRKLVRSPENLSPCDFDPLLSSSSSSNLKSSSPVKNQNDSTSLSSTSKEKKEAWNPPPSPQPQYHHQQQQQQYDQNLSSSLPPSISAPSMTIFRKPSISIKCSDEERDQISRASPLSFIGNQSSLALHQVNSKSIDSGCLQNNRTISVKQEQVDQASNNFLLKNNIVSSPIRTSHQQPSPQQLHHHHQHQSWFNDSSNYGSTKHDIYQQQQTEHHQHQHHDRDYGAAVEFSMSTSMDSNVMSQSFAQPSHHTTSTLTRGQMIFNHNNPFLSDSFENSTTSVLASSSTDVNGSGGSGGGSKVDENFFNIDDTNESDLLFFVERSKCSLEEEVQSSVRNKREKFSNASSTKICLVVSPPTNKFQVSII